MEAKNEKILYLLEDFVDLYSLCMNTSLSKYELLERLRFLKNMGYQIEKSIKDGETYYHLSKRLNKHVPFPPITIPDDYFRAIYISDTHYGSISDSIYLADSILEYALLHNIQSIFHLGDIIEGTKYLNLIRISDTMEQVFYVVENYPQDDSVHNYILFGNHDVYSVKQSGLDISKILFDVRPDFSYLGSEKAMFKLYDAYVLLLHSFRDYRIIQKKQDSYPNLLLALAGHFHRFRKMWRGNCLELRVASLLENDNFEAGAYDLTIPSDFEEILIRKLVFQPNLKISSESSVKTKRKVL